MRLLRWQARGNALLHHVALIVPILASNVNRVKALERLAKVVTKANAGDAMGTSRKSQLRHPVVVVCACTVLLAGAVASMAVTGGAANFVLSVLLGTYVACGVLWAMCEFPNFPSVVRLCHVVNNAIAVNAG